jgi:O-antigen/teichoic acid export membrane protein
MIRRISKDLLAYLPAKILPALTAFITVPIFTRLFTPDQYGQYMLAFGVSEFLLASTCTGFAAAAVRFYPKYWLEANLARYFSTLFASISGVTLITACVGTIALVLIRPLLPSALHSLMWVAIAVFIANGFFLTLMHILRAQEKPHYYTVFEVLSRFGTVALSLVLIIGMGFNVNGLLWGQFLALALPLLPLFWITTRETSLRNFSIMGQDIFLIWKFAWPLTLGNIAFWGLRLADRYIIEIFRGSYDVGLYSVSYNISARSIDLLVGLFLLVPGPIIIRIWEENGRKQAEQALTEITRFFILLVIPAVVGLAALSAPIVHLLAEDAYFEGHKAIWLVGCASMAFGFSQLGSFGVLLSKNTTQIALNQFVAAAISLILNLFWVPRAGFIGAAASACIAFILLACLQSIASAKFISWRWPARTLFRSVFSAIVMGCVVYLVGNQNHSETIFSQIFMVALSIVLGILIYAVMLWFMREISPLRILSAQVNPLVK